MRTIWGRALVVLVVGMLRPTEARCKAVPGSPDWPSLADWSALNRTLGGALIQTTVDSLPAAPCHPNLSTYNNVTCAAIQKEWYTWAFHEGNPVSNAAPNWNNDSCWPSPLLPCTAQGYPTYVVDATTVGQVQAAINFARQRNVRTNVKTSGHDFLGRSVAPNSLSIWLFNMHGVEVHENFTPKCETGSCGPVGPAITFSAGDTHGIVYAAADAAGLMVPVAGAPTVSYGGYVTGGGHSVMGATYGLAADLVQEISVVTPGGKLVTANQCSNADLFWALRGGGGATFGVIVSMTIQAFPKQPVAVYNWAILVNPASTQFYDIAAYATSQFTTLLDAGIMGYGEVAPSTNASTPGEIGVEWIGLDKTVAEIEALLQPIAMYVNQTWPGQTSAVGGGSSYPSFYEYWVANPDETTPVGIDILVGSRLLDKSALTNPNLSSYLAKAGPFLQYLLVGGPGVRNKSQELNSVCPGWRSAYIHATLGVEWAPLDKTQRDEQSDLLTNSYLAALRELAPSTGSYVNEADPFEPDFRRAFWGDKYPRLLSIKRDIDPTDVFWCRACVGNERWYEVGDRLCQL